MFFRRVTRQRPAGPTAQPTAACGTGSSVARRKALGSRAASPAGFGPFSLLDGPGLTQFKSLGLQGLGFKGLGFKGLGFTLSPKP